MTTQKLSDAVSRRFWDNVDKTRYCWNWTGYKNEDGYGQFRVRGKAYRAHRWAYANFVSPIPAGMLVCHKCDNPSCIKPGHLFIGKHIDNIMDCVDKKRHCHRRKTHCPKGHEYSPKNTYIRNKIYGRFSRACRQCKKEGFVRYRKQNKKAYLQLCKKYRDKKRARLALEKWRK